MKSLSFIPALLVFTAASAVAGVTYDFRMVSSGLQSMTIAGSVASDGPRLRMEVDRGDGMMFKDGSVVLSRDGGKTLLVFHPPSKTYFQLSLEEMTRGAADALKSPLLDVKIDAPKVSVHDFGDDGKIEGLPVRKMSMDATVKVNIDAMGQKLTSEIAMHSDNWSTDKIDPSAKNLFQMSNPRTGIEAFDKVMDAQSAAFLGRFPLKQVSTVRVKQDGREQVSTTTTTVTNVRQQAVDAARFADPAGYKQVENPIEALKRRMSGATGRR